ncbi:hypothetical protein IE81DRAFT_53770 [Ceraceosorus guamensis]|uniref:MSP domain-containing protein n=1 Tax=Ceraceosorus guamensis TaxID=1522189 RepID=A0A316W2G0_9BASI|nr:hypothetical protein IE81DRAFT_53770 [Ceraceosorus guamensis]PWN43950.1 hypothetical protein IE81DRAFT_53770 [Ceraceosorus guamensis]
MCLASHAACPTNPLRQWASLGGDFLSSAPRTLRLAASGRESGAGRSLSKWSSEAGAQHLRACACKGQSKGRAGKLLPPHPFTGPCAPICSRCSHFGPRWSLVFSGRRCKYSSLTLDSLTQPGPLTQLVKRSLQVSNPHAQPVAFKVKTTAPKQYCVRPNSGRIEPGEKVEVQVLLQPMKEEPPTSAKCRDKFLVQSTIITPERETTSLSELWGVVEKEDKSAIHEQKIRVAFLPAATAPVPEEEEHVGSNISNGDEKYSTVRGTPSRAANGSSPGNDDGSFSSPTQGSTSPANGTTNPIAAARSAAANTDGGALAASRNAAVAAGGAAAAGAGAAFAATKSAGSRAVEKTPAEYQSEIKRLQQQLDSATRKGAQQIQTANSEGVSLQVVGVLLVASFLLGAYLL